MTAVKKVSEDHLPVLISNPITRVQLAQYAGASGDFNPIHIDEEFAQNSPLKGVIAHGMLTMGFLSTYVEQLAKSPSNVKGLKVQFRSMVRLGDIITCEAKELHQLEKAIVYQIYAKNQNGEIVVKGETIIKKND